MTERGAIVARHRSARAIREGIGAQLVRQGHKGAKPEQEESAHQVLR